MYCIPLFYFINLTNLPVKQNHVFGMAARLTN